MSGGDGDSPLRYETIIIVGGGCYGGYYVRQLHRAARAGALVAESILVVDRDADCAVAQSLREPLDTPIPTSVRVADWRDFFPAYLTTAARSPREHERDAIVPSPLMPHLMAEWLVARAVARWPTRSVAVAPVETPVAVPWQRAGADDTYYVSFAEWTCPINCIEPRTCPVTRGPRSWSLPPTVSAYAEQASAKAAVMHCRHRTFGVGMFDTAEVLAADGIVRAGGDAGACEVFLATTSHCHGAITRLVIGPPAVEGNSPDH
jgi:hypothetical protein